MRKVLSISLFSMSLNGFCMVMEADPSNKRSYSQIEEKTAKDHQIKKKRENANNLNDTKKIQEQDIFDLIDKLRNQIKGEVDKEETTVSSSSPKDQVLTELENEREKKNAIITELTRQNKVLREKLVELIRIIGQMKKKDQESKLRNISSEQLTPRVTDVPSNNDFARTPVSLSTGLVQDVDTPRLQERTQISLQQTIALPTPQNEEVLRTPPISLCQSQVPMFYPRSLVATPWNTNPLLPMQGISSPWEISSFPFGEPMPQIPVFPTNQGFGINNPMIVIDAANIGNFVLEVGEYSGLIHLVVRGVVDKDVAIMRNLSILIARAPNLEILDLEELQLHKLPESVYHLRNLRELNVSKNKLTKLPKVIGRLRNLVVLNLGENQIKQLPESVGSLINLQKLSLLRNDLEVLPENIGYLANLIELNLSNNLLRKLPQTIVNLKNLRKLDLFSNQIREFPELILHLGNLVQLDIRRNPLTTWPEKFNREVSVKSEK